MADETQKGPPGPEPKQEKPKIIVDDDWKAQAKAEKEKLDEEIRTKQKTEGAAPGASAAQRGGRRGPRQLPPASFSVLVSSVGAQAMLALGGYEDPKTGRRLVDMEVAKHHIDTLAVLEEKTKGHLTGEEKQLLDNVLYESRMQFVEMAQRVSQMTMPPEQDLDEAEG